MKKTPDLPTLKTFIEMDTGLFCIDTFAEHIELLLRIEYELETVRLEDLPQISSFEDFLPYTHLYSNFKFLQIEAPEEKLFLKKSAEKENQKSLRDKKDLEFKAKVVELSLLAKSVLLVEDCGFCPASDCCSCSSLLAEAVRAPVANGLLNIGLLSKKFQVALRAVLGLSGS